VSRAIPTGPAVALLVVIWGTTWAAIRIGLTDIPPWTGAALRFLIAGSLLLALARALGVRFEGSRRERRLWLVNGTGSFLLSYGIVYWAEQTVPSGLTAVVFATFPLFVAVLAHFLLPGERLTIRSLGGLALGFGGVLVLLSPQLDVTAPAPGALLVLLLAPLAAAVANVAVKRWGSGLHPLSLTAVPMLFGAAGLGAVALVWERHHPLVWSPAAVGSLLYLAVFGSALTFTLFFHLLERLPASRLALFNYLVPMVAVATGSALLHEPVTGTLLVGGALILGGCALAMTSRRPSIGSARGRTARGSGTDDTGPAGDGRASR
jgi:drug/metabolite transporter (DMT)-like permease